MIPNNLNVAVVDNNLDGRKIEMKIDTAATVHLMSLLTALYSDQELACIREYSTNADDAHKDAGQTRPIEVTTPTSISPYFRVKDYGIGMDARTIEDVYSQYGRSTKRTQTNTNGSMGIGGKSALSYTNQFSVIGVKDSIKTHVSVSIGPDGGGIMEIVDESLTDEGNGVEILIPCKRYNDFPNKATEFFKYWAKGTVLLNGIDPTRGLTKVSDHVYSVDESSIYGKDVIVMGNVAYPVEGGLSGGDSIHKYGRKVQLAAFVTMNTYDEVVFTPSREGLIYAAQTNSTVEMLRAEYRTAVTKNIKDTMDNATTFSEAFSAYREFERTYHSTLLTGLKFQGQSMPAGNIRISSGAGTTVTACATIWNTNSYRYSVQSNRELSYESVMSALIITNYPSTSGVSGPNKAKVKAYRSDNDIKGNNVIFVTDGVTPGLPWTADAKVVDWSIIKAIRLSVQNSRYAGKSYGGGYDVFDSAVGYYSLTHDLVKTDEVVYYSKAKNRDSSYMSSYDREFIEAYIPDVKIVECGLNRHEKLVRLFPKAMTPAQAKARVAKMVVASLTPQELEQIRVQSVRHLDYLSRIDYTMINDPELSRALEVHRMKETPGTKAFAKIPATDRDALLDKIGAHKIKDITHRYPLLTWDTSRSVDYVIYINAKYATFPKGN